MRFGIIPVCCGFEAASRGGGVWAWVTASRWMLLPPWYVGVCWSWGAVLALLVALGGAWPAPLLGAGGFLGPRGPVLDMRQGSWCLVRDSGTPTPSSPPAGMSGLTSPRCADSGLGSPGSISICLWLLGAMILTSHPHVQTLAIHLCTLSFLLYSPPSYSFLPKTSSYCKPHLWMG